MEKTVLIGLGGVGKRVVKNVAGSLHYNNRLTNNDDIYCAVLDMFIDDGDKESDVLYIPFYNNITVRDVLEAYSEKGIRDWCPESPAFLHQYIAGMSLGSRIKGRLAFTDCIERGGLKPLEDLLNKALSHYDPLKITLVGSIAGAFASCGIIQLALWLRNFLKGNRFTIECMLLLPDVYDVMRIDSEEKLYLYGYGYATFKELNAINKIKLVGKAPNTPQIEFDDLFDSEKDCATDEPLYDLVYLFGGIDKNGVRFNSYDDYINNLSQIVYARLFTGMKTAVNSCCSNVYFMDNEPKYSSLGLAKAVYPKQSVKEYCTIRSIQEFLSKWVKINDTLNELVNGDKEDISTKKTRFIESFEALTDGEINISDFNVKLQPFAEQTKNKSAMLCDGEVCEKHSDKVRDFIVSLNNKELSYIVKTEGGIDYLEHEKEKLLSNEYCLEELKALVKKQSYMCEDIIDSFEEKTLKLAYDVVQKLFPHNLSFTDKGDIATAYSLLTYTNELGEFCFIHPIVAKYILIKLYNTLEAALKGIDLSKAKEKLFKIDSIYTDNSATAAQEKTFEEYLESRRFYQSEARFLKQFKERYAEFINKRICECKEYEHKFLQREVYIQLLSRIEQLLEELEDILNQLARIKEKFDFALEENVARTSNTDAKTVYVFASRDNKEEIYQSLGISPDYNDDEINKAIMSLVYAKADYVCGGNSILEAVEHSFAGLSKILIDAFENKMHLYSDHINMDIFTAIAREDTLNTQTPSEKLANYKDRLRRMAAPFCIYNFDDESSVRIGAFWGFDTVVSNTYPYVGAVLPQVADSEAPSNELWCMVAEHGVLAEQFDDFNETKGGKYYTGYNGIINNIEAACADKGNSYPLVNTPHLDKRWHKILPPVSNEQ